MNWLGIVAVLAIYPATCTAASARDRSPFVSLTFAEHREYRVTCAARYECDVQLEAGERVNDGFNAHIEQWDPHIGYSGDKQLTPHLVLRPSRAGLRTNIILTTTKRTYYILAISTKMSQASYYSFAYGDETYKALADLAIATQTALRASGGEPHPVPTATPANVASLQKTCFDFDYTYIQDPNAQSDHVPRGRPSSDKLPAELVPQVVCSDGSHTFIQFPVTREVPNDVPISLAVTAEGDTLINYTYLASLNRFTVDGVYDSFVLEVGSQSRPLRLRIFHAGKGSIPSGRRDPKPKPIVPPETYALVQSDRGAAFSGSAPTLAPARESTPALVAASTAPVTSSRMQPPSTSASTPAMSAPRSTPSVSTATPAASTASAAPPMPRTASAVASGPGIPIVPIAVAAAPAPEREQPQAPFRPQSATIAANQIGHGLRRSRARRSTRYAWLRKYDRPTSHLKKRAR